MNQVLSRSYGMSVDESSYGMIGLGQRREGSFLLIIRGGYLEADDTSEPHHVHIIVKKISHRAHRQSLTSHQKIPKLFARVPAVVNISHLRYSHTYTDTAASLSRGRQDGRTFVVFSCSK